MPPSAPHRPATAKPVNILIFGGTGDANRIATDLLREFGTDIRLQLSLAGVTRNPSLPDGIPVRVGSMGGVEGIIAHLGTERIDLVIDATHPYAIQISDHIARACQATDIPCLQFQRDMWQPGDGDDWIMAADLDEAARILPQYGERALIATGRKSLAAFEGIARMWLLVRTIEAPSQPFTLDRGEWLFVRGPFTVESELELLRRHDIDVVVCKNSGGSGADAKLHAARELGIPVIMIERPAPAPVPQAYHSNDILMKTANILARQ